MGLLLHKYKKMSINYTHIHLYKLISFSVLLVISIMLSYAESLIPMQIAGIGIKIGLANIATIVAIFLLSYGHGLLIGLLRVAILSYLFSNIIYFELSISGFIVSFIVMAIMLYLFNLDIKHIDNDFQIKLILTSIVGSVFHNIAQIVVCYFILGKQAIIFNLLFVLIPVAIITGIIVSFLSIRVLKIVKYRK